MSNALMRESIQQMANAALTGQLGIGDEARYRNAVDRARIMENEREGAVAVMSMETRVVQSAVTKLAEIALGKPLQQRVEYDAVTSSSKLGDWLEQNLFTRPRDGEQQGLATTRKLTIVTDVRVSFHQEIIFAS